MTTNVFQPQAMDETTQLFFRKDKHPSKTNLIQRMQGLPVSQLPYWETQVDPQVMATILEKPMTANSLKAEPEDRIEFCRRTGCSMTGLGIYYSPGRGKNLLETREGFEDVRRKGPPDFTARFDELKRIQDAAGGTDIGVFGYTHGPFDGVYLGMDLQNFWLLTVDDPGFLCEVGDYLLEVNLKIAEQLASAGVDLILLVDDLAFRSGLMVQPDFFFDYYPSRLEALLAPIRKANLPVVFHTDGKIDEVVDMLCEAGISALQPIEPYSNDIFQIEQLAKGRLALIGNVELALTDPQTAYEQTRKRIEGLGPRYVPGSSHSLTNDVQPEVYAAFLRAIMEGT